MLWKNPFQVLLALILAGSCLACGQSVVKRAESLPDITFHRQVGARRALVMMVSHESFEASGVDSKKMQQLMDGTAEIYAIASNHRFSLESLVVPEPVLLPGNPDGYHLSEVRELYAAANKEVLKKYGRKMDSDAFDVLVYFFPTDTNDEPFGMAKWKSTFGLRYRPAVVNVGTGTQTRPEAIAHELGHAFFMYTHAATAHPESGEILKESGDPYDLMGYGLNMDLINPPHLGMIYRYYWGWTDSEEMTFLTEFGTARLDPGRALILPTSNDNLLWLEMIAAEQAYADEVGGVLVRVDRAVKGGIYHSTLDMTPETGFQADLHMSPGQTVTFEGLTITYVKSVENVDAKTPSAEIRVE